VVIIPGGRSRKSGVFTDDFVGVGRVDHRPIVPASLAGGIIFRWMKSYARFNHLISHNREGVLLNFYVAVIGVTLMYLHMGHRPSKYMF